MKYRTLGRTGLKCSEIGLGTWAFASQVYGSVSQKDALAAIAAAYDAGINFYDTAPLYGTKTADGVAEEILGKGLRSVRDDVIISSKFGRNPTDDNAPNFHAQRATESVEASLRRLGTDRIDVLFFHSPFSADEIYDDVWDALTKLKKQGKVRFIGHSISKFADTQQMAREWAAERKIDVIQVVYSLMNREAIGLIHDLGNQNVGIVARESLANGFLSGKITKESSFPKGHINSRYSQQEIAERADYVRKLMPLVRGEIQTVPKAAMRWVLDQPGVSLVLSGARNRQEILECAHASDAPSYTAEELRFAAKIHTRDFQAA